MNFFVFSHIMILVRIIRKMFKTNKKQRHGTLLLHHTVYSLYLLLTFNLIIQIINHYHDFSCTIKNIPGSFHLSYLKITGHTVFLLFFIQNLLFCYGDIEENRGPKYSSLTFCHWNLNPLTAHDFTKISLL